MELGQLSGLGPKRIEKLKAIGVHSVEDLIKHVPRRYEWIETDLAAFKRHPEHLYHLEVLVVHVQQKPKYLIFEGVCDGQRISILFFHQNYRRQTICPNQTVYFEGRLKSWKGRLQMVNPLVARGPLANRTFLPIYPLTSGITQSMLRGWIEQVLGEMRFENEPMLLKGENLISLELAYRSIHFPVSMEAFEAARARLAAEEVFRYQLAQRLTSSKKRSGIRHLDVDLSAYLNALPFQLTKGQNDSLTEIRKDMESEQAMYRLLQGDVGSGKTVVAFLAMATAIESGYQTAYLAPTEVLAKQVYEKMRSFFEVSGVTCLLLTGSTKKKERERILALVREEKPIAVVGTHALFSDALVFRNLSLIVTDEQHRFGVAQRASLHGKGKSADLLAMSATPIPRTLAMTVYGEMAISSIRTRPQGRKPIKTYLIGPDRRMDAYGFLKREVSQNHRGFVVCPLIEEGEEAENGPQSIELLRRELRQSLLPEIPCGVLHGRMKKQEQDKAFRAFVEGDTPVLLSTTVVEVGVDVPEATVIFIESAERFGLAQLHQLRGRVGRSDRQSYCILICHTRSKNSIERMRVLVESQDGFEIAEKDLSLRGQGNLFGVEQHGSFGFQFFDYAYDQALWASIHCKIQELDEETLLSHAHYAKTYLDNLKEVRNTKCE